ncbi:MAG: hypothetical protein JST26_16995 [Bacteroidetes bacterium]|nr:hypothetical protein [Bacteroidota bacterium]
MISRIRKNILLFILIPAWGFASSLNDAIQSFEKDFSVSIIYNQKIEDSWNNVFYEYCTDTTETVQYITLLHEQYLKYPAGYFQKVGLNTIILGKNLRYGSQNRAAVPDPYKQHLFFSVDGSYGNNTHDYLVYVMHHELHHCTEYAIWKNMYYRWKPWQKANPCFFRYGKGGATAYEHLDVNWGGMTHPRKGFINLYATTGQEEDRCEIMAVLLNEQQLSELTRLAARDKKLRKKLRLLTGLLNDFTGNTDNYWTRTWLQVNTKKVG